MENTGTTTSVKFNLENDDVNKEVIENTDTNVIEDNIIEENNVIIEEPINTKQINKIEEEPITGIYNLKHDLDEEEAINLPTIGTAILDSYVSKTNEIPTELYSKDIDISHSVLTNLASMPLGVNKNLFTNIQYNNPDIVNEMLFNDKPIRFEEVTIKSGSKKKVAIDRIRNITRIGKNIQVALWNTGIRVTITVPPINALYDLKKKLREVNIESDIDTGGLLYSNKKILLAKEIVTFISGYIIDTTLDLPNGEELFDYIRIEDLPMLIIGISMSLYPNGNLTTVTCKYTTVFNKNIPSCTFVTSAKVFPKDLVKVDSRRMTNIMLEIISRRSGNSVSINDLNTYRKEFIDNEVDVLDIKYDVGSLKFELTSPTINEYLTKGNSWINIMLEKLYGLGNLNTEIKYEELDKLIDLNILGTYNSFNKAIIIDDEDVIEDIETINETLNELSQDNYIYNLYIKKVLDLISRNTIANIGTNNFICPKCTKKQKEEGNEFDLEFIWLDPLSYFLEILNSKLIKMQKRQEV